MVSDLAKYVLPDVNIDPQKVTKVTGESENEIWEWLEKYWAKMREYEKDRKEYLPHLTRELKEWKETIPNKDETKRQLLLERLKDAKQNPKKYSQKAVEQMLTAYKIYTNRIERLTDSEIQRARDYPIRDLLHVQNARGNISCPFHQDKTPSMGIKNNRFHCFSCGEKGDVITLYQKLNDCDFKTAVKALCG